MPIGRVLGEGSHGAAGLGILQAIGEHRVGEVRMAHAQPATCLAQQVWSIGHAFHAAGDDAVRTPGADQVRGEHGSLHPRATHLVDGGGTGVVRNPGLAHRLTGRCLLDAGTHHAAHQDLVDMSRVDVRVVDGGTHGMGAQLRRREVR